jgi:hypothetical protein
MGILNGYKHPRITVRSAGSVIAVIDLPLTNSEGMVETYEIKKLEHELLNYSVASRIEGFKIRWTLNYDEFITGDSMLLIKQLLEYAKLGYELILTPRRDHPWRSFSVYVSSGDFELALRKGGIAAKGHKNVVIELATVNLEPDLKWYSNDHLPVFTHTCSESIKFVL